MSPKPGFGEKAFPLGGFEVGKLAKVAPRMRFRNGLPRQKIQWVQRETPPRLRAPEAGQMPFVQGRPPGIPGRIARKTLEFRAGETARHVGVHGAGVCLHRAPEQAREKTAARLKAECPKVPVLALNLPNEGKLAVADYCVEMDDPETWLPIVGTAIP